MVQRVVWGVFGVWVGGAAGGLLHAELDALPPPPPSGGSGAARGQQAAARPVYLEGLDKARGTVRGVDKMWDWRAAGALRYGYFRKLARTRTSQHPTDRLLAAGLQPLLGPVQPCTHVGHALSDSAA